MRVSYKDSKFMIIKKKIKIRTKNIDCVLIGHTYNSSAYQFLVHMSSIEDIHLNIIIESRNTTLFEDVFL